MKTELEEKFNALTDSWSLFASDLVKVSLLTGSKPLQRETSVLLQSVLNLILDCWERLEKSKLEVPKCTRGKRIPTLEEMEEAERNKQAGKTKNELQP